MAQSVQVKKVSWWHEAIIDWMLVNPDKKLYECAEHFGVGQPWLSVVINSDCFKELYAQRRSEHNSYISHSLVEKTTALGHLAIEALTEKIEKERDNLTFGQLKDAADMALKHTGYSPDAGKGGGGDTNIFIGQVDRETLRESRKLMDQRQGREVIDVTPVPVPEQDEAEAAA